MRRHQPAPLAHIVREANLRTPDGRRHATPRGIYVLAPTGRILIATRDVSPIHVSHRLEAALAQWRALPADARTRTTDSPLVAHDTHAFADAPADGLRLRVTVRDLDKPMHGRRTQTGEWNQDNAWFRRKEARALLPAALDVGAKHDVPKRLVGRLARLHLIDFVRGSASAITDAGVHEARLATKVVACDGDSVRVRLTGRTHTESRSHHGDFGIALDLFGYATFDTKTERFTAFDVVALGTRWGADGWNGRQHARQRSPIGFALRLATGDAPQLRLPPYYHAWYGRQ